MQKLKVVVALLGLVFLGACSTNKNANASSTKAGEVRSEDQTTVSLLNQIRRLDTEIDTSNMSAVVVKLNDTAHKEVLTEHFQFEVKSDTFLQGL